MIVVETNACQAHSFQELAVVHKLIIKSFSGKESRAADQLLLVLLQQQSSS